MPEIKLSWEADEIRGGMRKIPGYSGHIAGLRQTLASTYGNASATVMNDASQPDELKAYPSCIVRNRKDGFTTRGESESERERERESVCVCVSECVYRRTLISR